MAKDQDIKINIATEANTAGADKAAESMRRVQAAAEKAQEEQKKVESQTGFAGQLDGTSNAPDAEAIQRAATAQEQLTTATQKYNDTAPAAEESTKGFNEEIEKTATTSGKAGAGIEGLAAGWTKAAGAFALVMGVLSKVTAEVDKAQAELSELTGSTGEDLGGLNAFMHDFANAHKILWRDLTGATAAYFELSEARIAKAVGDNSVAYVKAVDEKIKARKKFIDDREFETKINGEIDTINRLIAALERQDKVLAARRSSANAIQDAKDDAEEQRIKAGNAPNKGDQLAALEQNRIAREAKDSIVELNTPLEQANRQIQAMGEKATASQQELLRTRESLQEATTAFEKFNKQALLAGNLFASADAALAEGKKTKADGSVSDAQPFFDRASRDRAAAQQVIGDDSITSKSEFDAKIKQLEAKKNEQEAGFAKLSDEVSKLKSDITTATLDLVADTKVTAAKTEELVTVANEKIKQSADAASEETATKILETADAALKEKYKELESLGQQIPAALEAQQAQVIKLLNDGKPNAEQTNEISRTITELKSVGIDRDNVIYNGVATLLAEQKASKARWLELNQTIQQMAAQAGQ